VREDGAHEDALPVYVSVRFAPSHASWLVSESSMRMLGGPAPWTGSVTCPFPGTTIPTAGRLAGVTANHDCAQPLALMGLTLAVRLVTWIASEFGLVSVSISGCAAAPGYSGLAAAMPNGIPAGVLVLRPRGDSDLWRNVVDRERRTRRRARRDGVPDVVADAQVERVLAVGRQRQAIGPADDVFAPGDGC